MQSMDNPFVTKGYAGAEYFCDRFHPRFCQRFRSGDIRGTQA